MRSVIKYTLGIGLLILVAGSIWTIFINQKTSNPKSDENSNTEVSIPPVTSESPPFFGTIWIGNTIAGKPVQEGYVITVQFDNEGRLSGFDGCNTFSTGYSVEGANLSVDQTMASTKIACAENVMAQADAFTNALLATTSYQLGDGVLVLNQANTSGLTFLGQTNALVKTSWIVTGYNNGNEAVVSPILETELSITFGDDGTISGSSGCNTFSGQYGLSGQSITISPLATTLMACIEPEGIGEQETAFLNALQGVAAWQIQGNQLSLRTKDDALAITAIDSSTSPQM